MKIKKKIIPEGIAELNRFVGYDDNKIPINPITGTKANIKDESTWGSYEEAIQSVLKFEIVKGIGIVLGKTKKGTICGLDIDYCIDENGDIAKEAIKIIDLLDTYTEISPSGKGIHCLFYANKKGTRCKNKKLKWCKCLEMYDENRYFTLTGNSLGENKMEKEVKE